MSEKKTSKKAKAEGGVEHVAMTGLNYIPVGGKKEIRVEAGEVAGKLPKDVRDSYLERGDIKERKAAE